MFEKEENAQPMEIADVSTQSRTDYTRKSSISFNVVPMIIMNESPDLSDTNADDLVATDSMEKLTDNLSKMMRRSTISIPGVRFDDSQQLQPRSRSTNALIDDSSLDKDDELVIKRERGNTRRSMINFPTLTPRRVRLASPVTPRLSDNIAVRNFTLDFLKSENLVASEADAYADVIERILDQLELIRFTIPANVNEQWDESYKTMDEKYGEKLSDEEKEILKNSVIPATKIPTIPEKLQRDRTYIYQVLKALVVDLRLRRRYDSLEKEVDNITKTKEDQHNLEINHDIWTEQLEQIRDLISTEKRDSEAEAKKLMALVHESAAEIENATFACASKLDYIRKWEESRLEQQKLRLEMKEQALQNEISECMKDERIDEIVSSELRAFYRTDTSRMESEMQTWQERYNQEIDQHQREIDDMSVIIKDAKEALEEKYKLRDEKQRFIDECEAERAKKAEEMDYWSAIHAAAARIQALWRGYMVRHELRQYKGLKVKLKRRKKLAAKRRKKRAARLKKQAKKSATQSKK